MKVLLYMSKHLLPQRELVQHACLFKINVIGFVVVRQRDRNMYGTHGAEKIICETGRLSVPGNNLYEIPGQSPQRQQISPTVAQPAEERLACASGRS
jgi:hypothetical protein